LYEVGRDQDFDFVVVVACSPELELHRLKERDQLSEADARLRIAAQWPIAEKVARAHHVITTDAGVADTAQQVERLHARLSAPV
jgi:dephospho-CoA kinase